MLPQAGWEHLCTVGAPGRHGSGLHRRRLCTYPEKESMGAHRELPAGRKQQTAQAQTRWGANGGRATHADIPTCGTGLAPSGAKAGIFFLAVAVRYGRAFP